MHKNFGFILLCLLLVLFSGCRANYPPSEWRYHPPAGAQMIEAPKLVVGDRWIFEQKELGSAENYKRWQEEVVKVLPDDEYLILRTDLVKNKKFLLVKDNNLDFIAQIQGRKQKRKDFEDVAGILEFPMWVGKQWKRDVKGTPYSGGHVYNYIDKYRVMGKETVHLAGKHREAYKILRSSTIATESRFSSEADLWYVPDLKCMAKFYINGHINMYIQEFHPGGK